MKKVVSLFFAILMMVSLTTAAFAEVFVGEETMSDYYVEEMVAYGADAISAVDEAEIKAKIETRLQNEDLTLIGVATKSVYVTEGYNADGVYESRFMTKEEVQGLQAKKASSNGMARNLGEDSETDGRLTITISAYTNNARYQTIVYGDAVWSSSNLPFDPSQDPSSGEDYMQLSWGGGNEYLVADSYSCSGQYMDGTRFYPARAYSAPYAGYCWRFNEVRPENYSPATSISGMVTLGLTYGYNNMQGRQTYAQFNYIHTYASTESSVVISVPPALQISNCESQWPLSVALSGIPY